MSGYNRESDFCNTSQVGYVLQRMKTNFTNLKKGVGKKDTRGFQKSLSTVSQETSIKTCVKLMKSSAYLTTVQDRKKFENSDV